LHRRRLAGERSTLREKHTNLRFQTYGTANPSAVAQNTAVNTT
jgi:hypothetical protein